MLKRMHDVQSEDKKNTKGKFLKAKNFFALERIPRREIASFPALWTSNEGSTLGPLYVWTGYHYFHNFPSLVLNALFHYHQVCVWRERKETRMKFPSFLMRMKTNFFCWTHHKEIIFIQGKDEWTILSRVFFILSPVEITINKGNFSLAFEKIQSPNVILNTSKKMIFTSLSAIFCHIDRFGFFFLFFSNVITRIFLSLFIWRTNKKYLLGCPFKQESFLFAFFCDSLISKDK